METRFVLTSSARVSGQFSLRGDDGVVQGSRAKIIFQGMTTHVVTLIQIMDDGTPMTVLKVAGPTFCEIIDCIDGGVYELRIAEEDPCPSDLLIYVRQ
jgi:hypothetical protein